MRAIAVLLLLPLAGCSQPEPSCGSPVSTAALPEWGRAGFSGDGSGVPHVLGEKGDMLAVLFGSPLRSPPGEDRANKILWVPREPAGAGAELRIVARLDGTEVRAERTVDTGPSIVDLPRAGCWHLTLSWPGRTDTMDLIYE
ncbi:hypothetical protein Ade02nite_30950 [Paractinoplanes deccanensis]|uniref:Uncharacterized protein n=1 Tax=Paractinoplanes deccanensis TaxID=113561 RepID=A0ABQ3Y377_9ACTN|nr:hypothetical protein [Actinoplanes deccanensis]GID74454.1 hypothetical protein Ade02nite_30950 [Actinoplanes deccanensis]